MKILFHNFFSNTLLMTKNIKKQVKNFRNHKHPRWSNLNFEWYIFYKIFQIIYLYPWYTSILSKVCCKILFFCLFYCTLDCYSGLHCLFNVSLNIELNNNLKPHHYYRTRNIWVQHCSTSFNNEKQNHFF